MLTSHHLALPSDLSYWVGDARGTFQLLISNPSACRAGFGQKGSYTLQTGGRKSTSVPRVLVPYQILGKHILSSLFLTAAGER